MRRELPEEVTVDEAVMFLLNIDYTHKSNDAIEMLQNFADEANEKFSEIDNPEEEQLAFKLASLHKTRIDYAYAVKAYLDAEVASADKGDPSLLNIVKNFGNMKIVTTSLQEWADYNGFGIGSWDLPAFWKEPRSRNYQTEYLSVIDDVIRTFCEPSGKKYNEKQMEKGEGPKVGDVKKYIEMKYPEVSGKVLGPLITIVRKGFTG